VYHPHSLNFLQRTGMPPKNVKKRAQTHLVQDVEKKRRNEFEEKIQEMQVGVDDDPGISIYWSEAAMLHACLALPGSPVLQGATPSESARAIKDWFANIVLSIAPNAHVNDAYYQHIRMSEFGRIINRLLTREISVVWRDALENAQLTAGEMLLVTSEGRGRNEAIRQNFSPFI
jgi:hypothetical protein